MRVRQNSKESRTAGGCSPCDPHLFVRCDGDAVPDRAAIEVRVVATELSRAVRRVAQQPTVERRALGVLDARRRATDLEIDVQLLGDAWRGPRNICAVGT